MPLHRGTTVLDLLELPDGSAPERVVLDPGWLSDLHDPTLVITPGYVGPDRRRSDRTWDGAPPPDRRARLIRRAIQVLVTTVAVVVPLVLIASPAAPPAPAANRPAGSSVSPPTAGHVHRALRGTRALSQRSARAEATGRRALDRTGAAAAAVAGVAASTSRAPAAPSARPVARAEARARLVQVRAATRAAASRRRAVRAAARATAGARAPSPHGGRSAAAPVG